MLALVEVLTIPFSIYGFHKAHRSEHETTDLDRYMGYCTMCVMTAYFVALGIATHETKEIIASGVFLIGELCIALKRKIGWWLSIIANILLLYILLETRDYIFVLFQFVSIGIALWKISKK